MESEVEKKEGCGEDLEMITSRPKKGKYNHGVDWQQASIERDRRREPNQKEGRGVDRTDLPFRRQEIMKAAT